jgi:hypothetical protein
LTGTVLPRSIGAGAWEAVGFADTWAATRMIAGTSKAKGGRMMGIDFSSRIWSSISSKLTGFAVGGPSCPLRGKTATGDPPSIAGSWRDGRARPVPLHFAGKGRLVCSVSVSTRSTYWLSAAVEAAALALSG